MDAIKCCCGKLIGKYQDNKFYLYCKQCKKEIEIDPKLIMKESQRAKK